MRKSKKNNRRKRAKYSLRAQSANRQARRRGILLLVVLSLLVLFLLVGTAFITSSDDYRKASKTLAAPYEPAVNPLQHRDLLDETLGQLVRDTNNPHSSLRYHSLLRDLYGSDGFQAEVYRPRQATPDVPTPNPNFIPLTAKYAGAPGGGNDLEVFGPVDRQILEFAVYATGFSSDPNDPEYPTSLANPARPIQLSRVDNYYNGRVLTWTSGPYAGVSMRVIGYRYYPFNDDRGDPYETGIFRVLVPNEPAQPPLIPTRGPITLPIPSRSPEIASLANATSGDNTGASFFVNGHPFNGTGAGYNATASVNDPKLNAVEAVPNTAGGTSNRQVALMPNSLYFDPNNLANVAVNNYGLDWQGLGGSDESYDAVDFQNMALAWSPVNPIETVAYNAPSLDNMVIPSFHRPALINYWKNNATLTNEPGLLRKVMLRPSWFDHQQFDGSNPEFAATLQVFARDPSPTSTTNARARLNLVNQMIYGPWDVDNDNDSRRDSVWVDVGLPVMMSPQGRLVKPLAAILCVDLDGRLNLNAHGTRELADLVSAPTAQTLANGVSSAVLPEGQGYGPAEIDLVPVLQGPLNTSIVNASGGSDSLFTRVLQGVTTANLDETGSQFTRPWSGRYGVFGIDIFPGRGASYDLLAQLKQQGLPRRVAATSNDPNHYLGNYATPPDLMGRYALGLNDLGQPVYEVIADPVNLDLDIDSPYELNLSRLGPSAAGMNSQDGPFTVGELERILRAYDEDASKLPQRLWELANNFIPTNTTSIDPAEIEEWRGLLTTDSFDLPVPNVTLPEWMILGPDGKPGIAGFDDNMRDGVDDPNEIGTLASDDFVGTMDRIPVNLTFSDLLEYRVRLGLNLRDPTALTVANRAEIRRVVGQLLAPELADGTRLDLNRSFGNGRDDNGNGRDDNGDGQVDEMGEAEFSLGRPSGIVGVVDEPGELEQSYWEFDSVRLDAQSSAANTSSFTNRNGRYRDDVDRNGDGIIEPWERGDTDGSGRLDYVELVKLHNFRRQLFARHLYVLAMTLVDPVPTIPSTATLSPKEIREHKSRLTERSERLAQWAINVVDYRDPDNIMTAFEYDALPFNGWQPDGNLATTNDPANYSDNQNDDDSNGKTDQEDLGETPDKDGIDNDNDGQTDGNDPDEIAERRTVWGVERPEVVMTETLSWHDRATEDRGAGFEDAVTDENMDGKMDSKDEGSVGSTPSSGNDTDYDQRRRPQGATFIELYNPWQADTAANADTHSLNNSGVDLGVNLSTFVRKIPNDNSSPRSPVWRMKVHKASSTVLYGGGPDRDPDHPSLVVQPQNPDRTVYFTGFDPEDDYLQNSSIPGKDKSLWDDDGTAFYSTLVDATSPTLTNNHAIVAPGRYLVLGSGDETVPGSGIYEATIGDQQPSSGAMATRAIILDTNINATESVVVRDDDGMPLADQSGLRATVGSNLAKAFVIDSYTYRRYRNIPNTATGELQKIVQGERIAGRAGPTEVHTEGRFSVSAPAMGYPDHLFNSVWKHSLREYKPILDIPLDSQRIINEAPPGVAVPGDIVDGQVVLSPTDPRWFRFNNPAAPNPTNVSEMIKDDETRLELIDKLSPVRTIPGFSWIYLQRLANPTLPWNPPPFRPDGSLHPGHDTDFPVNPYRTIDSMGTNVTVFTGQAEEEKRRYTSGDIRSFNNADAMYSFASVQRGRANENDPKALGARLGETQDDFRKMSITSARTGGFIQQPHAAGGDPVAVLPSSLWGEEIIGRLNGTAMPLGMWINGAGPRGDGLRSEVGARTHFFNSVPDSTLGFLNEPFREGGTSQKIEPKEPFPWVSWNNRPFANGNELLQVPAFSSSQLAKTFSMIKSSGTNVSTNIGNLPAGDALEQYEGPVRRGSYPIKGSFKQAYPEIIVDGPFGHLLNFFRTRPFVDDPSKPQESDGIAGLQRVLEFVGVPSRYVGTEKWLSPIRFGDPITTSDDPRYLRQPPHNRISNYREPGRINLNTVTDHRIWDGAILHRELQFPANPYDPNANRNNYLIESGHVGPRMINPDDAAGNIFNPDFISARRGYEGVVTAGKTDDVLLLDSDFPTFFADPYRSPTACNHVPLRSLKQETSQSPLLRRVGVDKVDGGWGVRGVDDDQDGIIDDLSEAFLAFTPGSDGSWGDRNIDDDNNGFIDDLSEAGFGDDVLNTDEVLPLFASNSAGNTAEPVDAHRNPYFRYQAVSRMDNLTTTRSNVYAVWITIGFFEVEPAPDLGNFATINNLNATAIATKELYDRVYPEGYQYGRETEADAGQPQRLRMFAIVDRSVPVAFEPGSDHNVERAIRLKRRIE